MAGIEALKSSNVDFNILAVVTAQSARNAEKIYRFFKKNKLRYQQYIPCLDPIGERGKRAYSLTPDSYAAFFIELFDFLFSDIINCVFFYIRHFENKLGIMSGYPPEHCGMSWRCAMQYVTEADATVYPCDFYARDGYELGNFAVDGFDEIEARLEAGGFITQSTVKSPECSECKHYFICKGGCRRDREAEGGAIGLNYYCSAYKVFYDHAVPMLIELIKRKGIR
jgi:uncharacterized protein